VVDHGIYRLEHPGTGTMELFLTPVGTPESRCLEACCSTLSTAHKEA
jgi:hypothetical protein